MAEASKKEAEARAKMAADKVAADKAAAQVATAKTAAARAAQPKKGIVATRSLRIRKDHSTSAEVIAGLVDGNEVTILETWTHGKNTWAKLGPDQWAAIEYDGDTLIKVS